MKYFEILENLTRGLTQHFSQVYYGAEIIVNEKNRLPAVAIGDEWIDLSPSDNHETLYIRRNGFDTVSGDLGSGSCIKSYKMSTPTRIVYFRDHTPISEHWPILAKMMQSVLVQGVQLVRIINDKFSLQRQESSGNYNFGSDTAYFAIDVLLLWHLNVDTCSEDCITLENPVTSAALAEIF